MPHWDELAKRGLLGGVHAELRDNGGSADVSVARAQLGPLRLYLGRPWLTLVIGRGQRAPAFSSPDSAAKAE
jgi:hypothetical protein